MKKLATIIAVIAMAICFLLSCSHKGTYEDGYSDGYDDGYSEARWKFEDDYSRGYDDGYSEGYHEAEGYFTDEYFPEIINDAERYASVTGGWHPEEAWGIVESYLTHTPTDDGIPSYEEYRAAVDSLICFYEYFYGRHY